MTNVPEGAEEERDDVGKEVRRRGLLHALKDVLFQVVLWRLLQQTQTQGEGVVLPRERWGMMMMQTMLQYLVRSFGSVIDLNLRSCSWTQPSLVHQHCRRCSIP